MVKAIRNFWSLSWPLSLEPCVWTFVAVSSIKRLCEGKSLQLEEKIATPRHWINSCRILLKPEKKWEMILPFCENIGQNAGQFCPSKTIAFGK